MARLFYKFFCLCSFSSLLKLKTETLFLSFFFPCFPLRKDDILRRIVAHNFSRFTFTKHVKQLEEEKYFYPLGGLNSLLTFTLPNLMYILKIRFLWRRLFVVQIIQYGWNRRYYCSTWFYKRNIYNRHG